MSLFPNPPDVTIKDANGNTVFSLQYIPKKQFVYAHWVWDYEQGIETVYEGCEAILQLLKEKSVRGILNDTRLCRDSWDEANDWIANDWTPRAIAEGLAFLSFIVSEDIFSQLAAEELQQQVVGFTMRNHSSADNAIAWLEEKLKQKS